MEKEKIDEGIINLLGYIRAVNENLYREFISAPASSRWHNNWKGGLLDHSKRVVYKLCEWKDEHPNSKLDYYDCIIVGILHDLCKHNLYKLDSDGKYTYDKERVKRHSGYSLELIKGLGVSITPMQRVMILLHMNGWETNEDWSLFSKEDKELLQDNGNFAIMQAMCWADMRADQEEVVDAKTLQWEKEKQQYEKRIKELEVMLNGN